MYRATRSEVGRVRNRDRKFSILVMRIKALVLSGRKERRMQVQFSQSRQKVNYDEVEEAALQGFQLVRKRNRKKSP